MASDYLKYCYFVCSVRMEKLRRITDRLAPQPIQAAENISVLAKVRKSLCVFSDSIFCYNHLNCVGN